jgi:hypothetical protein
MASYSFSSREIAEALANVGRKEMAGSAFSQDPTGRETIFVKTPSGGVAARSGDVCTAEDCTRVYLSEDPSTALLELSEKPSLIVPVVNTTEQFIEGDTQISATRVGVYWVFASGGGGAIKTFQSSSAITGRNQNNAGTGTAVSYTYDDSSNLFVLGTENPPYNIINPYSLQVSQGIVIQCKPCNGGKWEIVQAECETPEEETP